LPNFSHDKLIEFIRSYDQQLIGIEELVDEFIDDYPTEEESLGVNAYLEMMAQKIRSSIE